MSRRTQSRLASLACAALLLAACGDEAADCDVNVRVLYPAGGTGDRSFADLVFKGITTAKTFCAFDEVAVDPAEPPEECPDAETIRDVLECELAKDPGDNELVITVGFQYQEPLNNAEPCSEGSTDAPPRTCDDIGDRHLLHLDTPLAICCPTVRAEAYDMFAPSWIAGHVAFAKSQHGIRIIAGEPTPPVLSFIRGFRAGVEAAGGDGEAACAYYLHDLGDQLADELVGCEADHFGDGVWRNPACARALSRHLYETETADVILPVAGGSSFGVIDAAQELAGRYTFGVDADQSVRGPEVVLGSVRKRLDLSVLRAINDLSNGGMSSGNHLLSMFKGSDGRTGTDFYLNPNPVFDELQQVIDEALVLAEADKPTDDILACRPENDWCACHPTAAVAFVPCGAIDVPDCAELQQ